MSFSLGILVLKTFNVLAKPLHGESILCNNKDLYTVIAFSTTEYNIAICKEFGDAYHYIGQDRKNNRQIFLPITEKNNPHSGANPFLLKARNGEYTYQVAEFNWGEATGGYVSISVFQNGKRIYQRTTDVYISSEE
jgi:hypothetical protein